MKLFIALIVVSNLLAIGARADDCKEVLATGNALFEKASQDYPTDAEACVNMKAWRAFVKSATYKTCLSDKDSNSSVQDFMTAVDQDCGK